jgi:hypothetical protein
MICTVGSRGGRALHGRWVGLRWSGMRGRGSLISPCAVLQGKSGARCPACRPFLLPRLCPLAACSDCTELTSSVPLAAGAAGRDNSPLAPLPNRWALTLDVLGSTSPAAGSGAACD